MRPLSTSRVETAIEIARVAHARDTTLEKRNPDHLAMIGAPVQQLVAEFERRRSGSQWRREYFDLLVNVPVAQHPENTSV